MEIYDLNDRDFKMQFRKYSMRCKKIEKGRLMTLQNQSMNKTTETF